jgi:phenylpyruvate tautomerase PptA (4-oxalocrotonate tautomerase family)
MNPMPVFTIDAPSGVRQDAKQKMMKQITEALDEAWPIPDTRGWLREYPAENVSQDGHIQAEPVRPVCSLEAPELANLDVKRKLVQKIESAIATAYAGIANTEEVLVLINHYPLENVGWQQSLQSDKPEIVAAIAQINR